MKPNIKQGSFAFLAAATMVLASCVGQQTTPTTDPSPGPPQVHDARTLFSLPTSTGQEYPILCGASPYDGTMAIPEEPEAAPSLVPCGSSDYLIVGPDWTPGAAPLAKVLGRYAMDDGCVCGARTTSFCYRLGRFSLATQSRLFGCTRPSRRSRWSRRVIPFFA